MAFWDFLSGSTPAGVISETGHKMIGGVFDGVTKIISEFHLSPEDELKFKTAMAQLQLDTLKTELTDVQSARQMQMQTHSIWPGIISFVVLFGFFGILLTIIFNGLPPIEKAGGEAFLILLGALGAGFTMVMTFWLGSSSGSESKNAMLWKSVPLETQAKGTP